MNTNIATKRPALNYFLIALVVLFCHGLLLLNDGLYHDDIYLYDLLKNRDWETLYTVLSMYGNTYTFFYDWFFSFLPHIVFAFKLIAFVNILLSAFLTYRICVKSGFLGPTEGMFVAMLSAVYPAHMMTFVINISYQFTCYTLFLVAVNLAMDAIKLKGARLLIWRILTCGIFFLSFMTNSLLVFHSGFLLFYYAYSQRQLSRRLLDRPFSFAIRHWDFIVIPFVFWIWKQNFTPVWGWASGYNEITFNLTSMLSIYIKLALTIAWQLINTASNPFFSGSFILFGAAYYAQRLKWHTFFRPQPRVLPLLIFGLLLLFLGTFPYAAVGKGFGSASFVDWSSRNRLLIGLPMALILVVTSLKIFKSPSRWNLIFLVALVLTFSSYRVNVYVTWQAEAIKHHSTLFNLSNLEGARDIHVFGILDGYPIAEENTMLWWGIALKQTFGDFTRFGFYEGLPNYNADSGHWYSSQDIKDRVKGFYGLTSPKEFDPRAKQAQLIIERGGFFQEYTFKDSKTLVMPYYYRKFIKASELPDFLRKFTKLTLIPLTPPSNIDLSSEEKVVFEGMNLQKKD